jgi:hypothetical protein
VWELRQEEIKSYTGVSGDQRKGKGRTGGESPPCKEEGQEGREGKGGGREEREQGRREGGRKGRKEGGQTLASTLQGFVGHTKGLE